MKNCDKSAHETADVLINRALSASNKCPLAILFLSLREKSERILDEQPLRD